MKEEWKKIEYDIRYQVSNFGRFRKQLKKGYKYLKPFKKNNLLIVKIRDKNLNCARLVASYHIRKLCENERIYHKNKNFYDNFINNLKICNLKSLGKLTGYKSRSKKVFQIDNNKEILKIWRSARECGKELFISYQTVNDYCNNKVKKPMYKLCWGEKYDNTYIEKYEWEK